jgi:hypothetical protein
VTETVAPTWPPVWPENVEPGPSRVSKCQPADAHQACRSGPFSYRT